MKLRIAATLGLTLTVGVLSIRAQDRSPSRSESRIIAERQTPPKVSPSNNLHLPSSPVLPMTNPVAPMTTAPVQPFVRYQGPQGTPTVVIPPAEAHVGEKRRRGNDGVAVVPWPIYVPYEAVYYEPPPTVAPTPGVLPGTDPGRLPSTTEAAPPAVPGPAPVGTIPAEYRDSNVVITPQAPLLAVEPPPLGTTRAQAIVRYGEPWGRVTMRGQDTLYFNGGLVLVFEDDRVVAVR